MFLYQAQKAFQIWHDIVPKIDKNIFLQSCYGLNILCKEDLNLLTHSIDDLNLLCNEDLKFADTELVIMNNILKICIQ